MIVLVSCGKRKLPHSAPAGRLYTGPFVSAALAWARSVTDVGSIFIVSARYGLVPHECVIDPYELTLGEPGAVTPATIRAQADRLGILRQPVYMAGGARYAKLVRDVWENEVVVPFGAHAGQHSQGAMLAAMRAARGRVPKLVDGG